MTITEVHELGEPFSVNDEHGVFSVRSNPAGPAERIVGFLFGLAFLGFAVFVNVIEIDAPTWGILLLTVCFGGIGLWICKASMSKAKSLRYVELDANSGELRYGEEKDGVREPNGRMRIDEIQKVRVKYHVDKDDVHKMERRAKDGKPEMGYSRLLVRGPGEAPRKGEVLSGDYYVLDELRQRIEAARSTLGSRMVAGG